MVQLDNIDIYVVYQRDHAQRYTEYTVPLDSKANRKDIYERYIEAVDEQRFALIVHIGDDFDFKGATHININWAIDAIAFVATLPEDSARGKLVIDSIPMKVNGNWLESGFKFKHLALGKQRS